MTNQPGGFVVGDASPENVPAIADIWRRGWQDGHLGHVPAALAAARTVESFSARAGARVLDTRVARVDRQVVGFTMVSGDEVEQIYVDESLRGHGVANLLLADAERRIGDAGHESGWLAVVPGNLRARRFYERSGWVDAGPFDYDARDGELTITVRCRRYVKRLV